MQALQEVMASDQEQAATEATDHLHQLPAVRSLVVVVVAAVALQQDLAVQGVVEQVLTLLVHLMAQQEL